MDLQTLKNNYAQEKGYDDWDEIMFLNSRNPIAVEDHMNEICIRAQKAALEKAADNAKTTTEEYYVGEIAGNIGLTASRTIIDRTSITKPENLIR